MLLLTGFVLVLAAFLLGQDNTVDIHVHDTYFVIAQGYFFILLAFAAWILWILYLLTRKILHSKSLTWIHVIITILLLLLLLFLVNFGADPLPRRYLDFNNLFVFNRDHQNRGWIAYSFCALVFAQITFIVNLMIGIFKRLK